MLSANEDSRIGNTATPKQRAFVRVLLRAQRAMVERFRAMANDMCDAALRDVRDLEAWADGGPVPARAARFVTLTRAARFSGGASPAADQAEEALEREYNQPFMFMSCLPSVAMQLAASELRSWEGRWPSMNDVVNTLEGQVCDDFFHVPVQLELMDAANNAIDGMPVERRKNAQF